MTDAFPLLEVRDLSVRYSVDGPGLFSPKRELRAVEGVSFDLAAGEILGIVGESGCGKSSLGRAILQLIPASGGEVRWQGNPVNGAPRETLRRLRREMSIIFQDPLAALDPQMSVGALVREPLDIFEPRLDRAEKRRRVIEALDRAGMVGIDLDRYPHQFSGGQCQRIGIARALILRPKLILCDEPVSALDVSVQAQILQLLAKLRREEGLALLFIAHNLAVVRQICDRVMVLYLGHTMEIAGRDQLYAGPKHPYTKALLAAAPIPDAAIERARQHVRLTGELPDAIDPPKGCVFNTRCAFAEARCRVEVPELEKIAPGHQVACHRWREI